MKTAASTTPPETIDAYIAGFNPEVQALLQQVRATITRAAPQATECISYRIPAFKLQGMLMYFAAFKKHIGLYPPVSGSAALVREAARYAGPKGNLQFPLTEPLPLDLIERIVLQRVQRNMEQAAAKEAKRRG